MAYKRFLPVDKKTCKIFSRQNTLMCSIRYNTVDL